MLIELVDYLYCLGWVIDLVGWIGWWTVYVDWLGWLMCWIGSETYTLTFVNFLAPVFSISYCNTWFKNIRYMYFVSSNSCSICTSFLVYVHLVGWLICLVALLGFIMFIELVDCLCWLGLVIDLFDWIAWHYYVYWVGGLFMLIGLGDLFD